VELRTIVFPRTRNPALEATDAGIAVCEQPVSTAALIQKIDELRARDFTAGLGAAIPISKIGIEEMLSGNVTHGIGRKKS